MWVTGQARVACVANAISEREEKWIPGVREYEGRPEGPSV